MHERGMDPVLCRNPYEAMALLVRREQGRRTHRPSGLTVVLILADEHWPPAAALFRSASVHCPHAAFWRYDAPTRRLAAFDPPDPPPPERPSAFGDLVVRRG
ncbi:MAG TPA: hypothetical protein DEB06_08960, partial [Phycisphaerales bacterium]|nr:hypothetical protein [Phycisphaerales bacterium]